MTLAREVLVNGLAAAQGRRVPFALSYHGLGDVCPREDPHGLMTDPDVFVSQLDTLLARGYRLVGITELWVAVRRGGRAADGLGAITFDDGLADAMHLAAELCSARGVTPTMFLAPGLFGTDHPDLSPGRRILRADEVADLERDGCELGAHSHGHVDLPALPRERQLEELRTSRGELEELLRHPVRTMAYPFGRHDAVTRAAAEAAGYEIACANSGTGPWEPFALPREAVHPSASTVRIRLKAAGLYGTVTALRGAARRQRRVVA